MTRRIIYKYPLKQLPGMGEKIETVKGAKLLTLQMQKCGADYPDPMLQNKSIPMLWFECDPDEAARETHIFFIIPTGQTFPGQGASYVGTFQDDWFVGHVYEAGKA